MWTYAFAIDGPMVANWHADPCDGAGVAQLPGIGSADVDKNRESVMVQTDGVWCCIP